MKRVALIVVLALASSSALLASGSALAHGGRARVHLGFHFGAPLFYHPWRPWYYAPAPVYHYYPAPIVVQPASPPVYVERSDVVPEGTASWYYCRESNAYYPYVKQCPGGWERVPAQPGR